MPIFGMDNLQWEFLLNHDILSVMREKERKKNTFFLVIYYGEGGLFFKMMLRIRA